MDAKWLFERPFQGVAEKSLVGRRQLVGQLRFAPTFTVPVRAGSNVGPGDGHA